jgi:hypothetical protein
LVTSTYLQSFLRDACNSIWAIFLFKGGKVFIGIYSVQQEGLIKKKLFKKYTERRKQGGSQLLRDKSGKVAKSAGSQVRRQNELDLLSVLQEPQFMPIIFLGCKRACDGVGSRPEEMPIDFLESNIL